MSKYPDVLHERVTRQDPCSNNWEHDLLNLYGRILREGEHRDDRTGTGTIALFGEQLKIDLSKGFPAITTKKLAWKAVASELLWFIEGSGDERRLAEILHGTRDSSKKTIWSPNAEATSGSKFQPAYSGDLGRVYGVQWRHWKQSAGEVDQLADVISKLKNKPTDRRIILSAWNPGELDQMALPPCHMFAQFYLSNDNKLSCQMYQRSVDTFLGLPFNIASYALLTHMIAHVVKSDVGILTMCLGDTHVYSNHVEQVKTVLSRMPHSAPRLVIHRAVESIDDFRMDDFELVGYTSHEAIAAEMAA